MPTARTVALKLLRTWTTLDRPPLLPERSDPLWATLEPRERPAALDLVTGIIRHRALLDAVIRHLARRPLTELDPIVLTALWLGTYQLLFHDDTPAYAVVDTTVELAKQNRAPRAAGLVNALLRGLLRLNPTIEDAPASVTSLAKNAFPRDLTHRTRLAADIFPDPNADVRAHLATVTSHPRPLVNMLVAALGPAVSAGILVRNNERPSVLLRADDPAFTPPADAGLEPHQHPRFFIAAGGWNPTLDALVAAGTLSPQDPAAARAVDKLAAHRAALPTPTILDLCAGLGTKSIQLARAFPKARVLACDIASDKLARLTARASALHLANLSAAADTDLPAHIPVILVDAPCSNSGVLSRRVQARWRWTDASVVALTHIQRSLLTQALTRATPPTDAPAAHSSTVVYATCSIDPRENTQVVRAVLADHPRAKIFSEETLLPAATPDPRAQHDGAYIAIIDIP